MQLPIEMLARVMKRGDSGIGVQPKAGTDMPGGSQFAKIFENALAETSPMITDEGYDDTANAGKETAPVEHNEPEEPDMDETLAAGVTSNQEIVVFILEGDKESATDLEARVDAEQSVDASNSLNAAADTNNDATIAHPVPVDAKVETKPAIGTADVKVAENTAYTADAVETPEVEAHQKKTAPTVEATTPETDTASETGSTTGEVKARMPVTRTSERQGNEEQNSDFSEKGILSPLENENDEALVKEQKGKTYPEAFKAVKNTAEGVPDTANHTPVPLTEGIKPDQFRADQQMKQASMDAPVKAENLFEEMVSRIETIQTDSQSKMSIQLKPEFLGKVAMEIAMDTAGLHVKISAEDSGIRTMINSQINALIESLENKGIEVVEVEVAYTGVDNGSFKESKEDQAQSKHPRRKHRETEGIDGVAYYTALPFDTLDYYLDSGVSSVEYRA